MNAMLTEPHHYACDHYSHHYWISSRSVITFLRRGARMPDDMQMLCIYNFLFAWILRILTLNCMKIVYSIIFSPSFCSSSILAISRSVKESDTRPTNLWPECWLWGHFLLLTIWRKGLLSSIAYREIHVSLVDSLALCSLSLLRLEG